MPSSGTNKQKRPDTVVVHVTTTNALGVVLTNTVVGAVCLTTEPGDIALAVAAVLSKQVRQGGPDQVRVLLDIALPTRPATVAVALPVPPEPVTPAKAV